MTTSRENTPGSLYHDDFYSWTQQQAALLKSGQIERADLANIVEEIETLGRSELAALRSAYRLVALNLLKLRYQPTHRTGSWTAPIVRERNNIADLLHDNPGLRPKRDAGLVRAYPAARREAADETSLSLSTFPQACPFTLEQIEDHDFWP